MYRALIFVLLLVTWIVLSGQFDKFHLTLGFISCGIVCWLSSDLLFHHRDVSLAGRLRQALGVIGYSAFLLVEIFKANLHVMRLALLPGGLRAVKPQVFKFRTHLKTDFAKWVLANSITLTPGTVTIRVRDDWFYVHAISSKVLMESGGEMEHRIRNIYEPEESA